jgi:ribosomal protein S18 acetylase RimI-like enzyme
MEMIDSHEPVIEFKQVIEQDLVNQVKALFLEYAQSLNIDLCFQDFDAELETLPGKYSPPDGILILVLVDGKAAGCAALRKITKDICEMKRLYVRVNYREMGIGSSLVAMVIEEALKLGYQYIRLDTLPEQKNAHAIYESFGFCDIKPYIYNPVAGARYMELDLKKHS